MNTQVPIVLRWMVLHNVARCCQRSVLHVVRHLPHTFGGCHIYRWVNCWNVGKSSH